VTDALSFTGFVFGMQQTAVESAARRRARSGFDRLGRFLPRLAKMRVNIDEPSATIKPVASKISTFCAPQSFLPVRPLG